MNGDRRMMPFVILLKTLVFVAAMQFCCISLNGSDARIVRHTKANCEMQFVNGNINSHIIGT